MKVGSKGIAVPLVVAAILFLCLLVAALVTIMWSAPIS